MFRDVSPEEVRSFMPQVRVPRKGVTPEDVITVLTRRLGAGYRIERSGVRDVTVRDHFRSARVVIRDAPGATVFRVRGGGLLVLRVASAFTTARQVADALRRSQEFRSI